MDQVADDAAAAVKKKRGRKPGPVPFDKKKHDREMSAKRRAAKKAASGDAK